MFIGSSRNLNKKVKNNSVLLNNAPMLRADTFTCLRVDLDEQLSWEKHIETRDPRIVQSFKRQTTVEN